MMPVALATEDILSEAIGLRLLAELPVPVTPNLLLRKDGFGYLRSGMNNWRQLAQHQTVLVLTDLDQIAYPVALRADWLGNKPAPAGLLLRIAVREVEAWVLADHEAMRKLMEKKGALPPEPDSLPDPQATFAQTCQARNQAGASGFGQRGWRSGKSGHWLQQASDRLGKVGLES